MAARDIEKRQELWSDSAGLQAFVQYGRLHIQFGNMVLRLSAFEARRTLPPGIEVHLRDSGRLTVQPEVSNALVLRKEDA